MLTAAIDTVVSAETPEGIVLELRPAGLPVRFCALAVDWAIRIAVLYAALFLTLLVGAPGTAFWLILLFAMEWLYPVWFELTPSGATPGKRVFGLRVVMDSGLPVTPGAAFARNLLRAADFLPFGFGLAIVSMLTRADSKRLGDLAAGTLVVYAPRAAVTIELHDVDPLAPVRPLSPRDQAAVMALAARAPRLTIERVDELAALAATVSGDDGRAGPAVTRRVLGVAQWLLGRRA